METEKEMKRRFATQLPGNLIANISYFLVHLAVGILLVPYFVSTLGVAAYGLIPLASTITGYVSIVVQSLNTTLSRFLTIDLQKQDFPAANRTFNTAFFGLSALIVLMIPVIIVVSNYIPVIFNVPAGYETDAIILFLCAITAFLIRSLIGTCTVQLFAYNRLDLINIVNIVYFLVQVGLTVLLFWLAGPSLVFVGAGYLAGAIVSSVLGVIFARRICPHLNLSPGSFDRSQIQNLGEMGVWIFINQVGGLLFLQIDLIVVNMIFGATSAGEYAIALTWGNSLRSIAGVFAGVLTPMVLTFYAREHTDTMIQVTKSAVKLMGITMALPIGLVCGFAPQLLTVWVGEQFAFLAPLMILMTIHLIINLAVLPLSSIRIAYNRVRIPALVTLGMGILNVTLAVILALYSGLGYYGVAAAGAIVLTLTTACFSTWYTARIMKIPSLTFVRSMVFGVIGLASVIGSIYCITFFFTVSTLPGLFVSMGVVSVIYLIGVLLFGLNHIERNLLSKYVPQGLRRFIIED